MSHPSAFSSEGSQEPQRQLQLVVHAGPLAGKGFPISKETLTFGRDPDNDIMLDDTKVSRHHARLLRQGDQILVEDLGSTNGTLINGEAITGQHLLQPADIISIGTSLFGVKGFSAPNTIGVTQVTGGPVTYTAPRPSIPTPAVTPNPTAHSPAPSSIPAQPQQKEAPPSRFTLLAVGGAIALIVTILIIAGITAFVMTPQSGGGEIPTVNITAPITNSEVQVNRPITVQATGSSAIGVTRMVLFASGVEVDEAVSPAANGQQTLTASFQWTPTAPGTFTLEVRAFDNQGGVSLPTTVSVSAIGDEVVEDPTITPTPEPIETVAGDPSLRTKTDLNVRAGPGIEYALLGLLPTSTEAQIIGRDPNRQWWQIRFDPAPDGRGWVAADTTFSDAENIDNVPVVEPPPTPTGTPTATATNTPLPPTETPTETPLPDTATPTATATEAAPTETPTPEATLTPTGEATSIQFEVSPSTIIGGDCVTITWNVTGVKEVYFNDVGVGGSDTVVDCPTVTTTYRLRVVKLDDTEQTQEIEVVVSEEIGVKSEGTLVIEAGESLDIDDGDIPGDDFTWDVDPPERHFEVQDPGNGTEIAIMGNFGSLNDVSRSDCLNASYNIYTFIDASNSAPDPTNTLIDGRTICFKTNKGRIGKMRFPNYSTDELTIEWVTWQK